MTGPTVVAGLTPQHCSLATVTWAAEYAARTGSPLRVVLAEADTGDPTAAMRAAGCAVTDVRTRFPQLALTVAIEAQPVVDALVALSDTAHLLVVDQDVRRRPLVAGAAAEAFCPVVAVGSSVLWSEQDEPVLVGADGTERSRPALEWAFAEADRLGRAVRVVHCQVQRSTAGIRLRHEVLAAVATLAVRHPAVEIQLRTLDCPPDEGLSWHSQFCAMAVIGHRAGTATGRTERAVLRNASCAVVLAGQHTSVATAIPALHSPRS
ncbi:universal stress protein [Kutzneria viridogrisea]|uniref:UspA domain-containing protein n=2 Tax=Kutzneria TaxID=43356 RepID=W5W8R7_9PSEU|nr:universal stress protein [Kutzneria albida]AHH96936.1 hypothetical protein KALB_3572 [Kutzneria albida DSM 43870]MBA8927841.1 nucleotide-binding universal stress UspA family protein [Kutzneria viridogrisea]